MSDNLLVILVVIALIMAIMLSTIAGDAGV